MKICIRPATTADVDFYLWVACGVESPTYIAITDRDKALEEMAVLNVFIIECDRAGIDDGVYKEVGYVSYEEEGDDSAYLSELAVHPAFQGRGIGDQALDLLIGCLMNEGFTYMYLYTHPENRARRFYERHGFAVTGEPIQDYLGSGQPRIVLSRTLRVL